MLHIFWMKFFIFIFTHAIVSLCIFNKEKIWATDAWSILKKWNMMKYNYPNEINIKIDFFRFFLCWMMFKGSESVVHRYLRATLKKNAHPKSSTLSVNSAFTQIWHIHGTNCDMRKNIFAFEKGYTTFLNKVFFWHSHFTHTHTHTQ